MNIQMIFQNKVTTYDTKADGDAWFTRSELEVVNGIKDNQQVAYLEIWNRLKYVERKANDPKKDPRNNARADEGFPEIIAILPVEEDITDIPSFCEEWSKQQHLLRFDINGETFWSYTDKENTQLEG